MNNRNRVWLWLPAAVSILAGGFLVMNDSGAGWFLVIMGIVYLGVSTHAGQGLTESNPDLARWALIGVTVLFILLTIVVGAALQLM